MFRHVPQPTAAELQVLIQQIAARTGRLLKRRGIVERDIETAWLGGDSEAGPLDDLIGHSITYRIAVGLRAGQKLFTLQTVPAMPEVNDKQGDHRGAARTGGFSLHAGIDIEICARCGGRLAIISSIEEPEVIAKILAHTSPDRDQPELPLGARASPLQSRLI